MLERERIQFILEKIKTGKAVHVETLANETNVSTMTIRRDLAKLAKNGLIDRCHGGALLKRETPYQEKQISNLEEKQHIARTALRFVEENSTVFLDAGTTTWQIALLLSEFPSLKVVTADLEIANHLKRSEVQLFVCGGEVQKKTGSMIGWFTNNMLENMRFDVSFIGAPCIDQRFDVLTPTAAKAELKRLIVKNSCSSFLTVDSSKFYKQAMTRINSLADYTGVITTKEFSQSEQQLLLQKNITLIKG
ncbi:DeoR/GlpR family DNA-binding transcription regulator [Treponema brennaborense]|uniref:Transcriptional regulator, DeoR family n=1 Tax=Treponema brennaborense (strain DSM 12168 / CIP 105900 / DD5/3) TaxID=906968 RepID=F4LQ81_TREBD|nr:DeoR/GlpR family DNA-binding transcription regulator [Treponema brennaborense]AEE16102.1 transcriptional regulator, DeoR family [Treponema brennaborense DSM 12168]